MLKLECLNPTRTLSRNKKYECFPIRTTEKLRLKLSGYLGSTHYQVKNDDGKLIYVNKDRFKITKFQQLLNRIKF